MYRIISILKVNFFAKTYTKDELICGIFLYFPNISHVFSQKENKLFQKSYLRNSNNRERFMISKYYNVKLWNLFREKKLCRVEENSECGKTGGGRKFLC
jgi:hypothetical protein